MNRRMKKMVLAGAVVAALAAVSGYQAITSRATANRVSGGNPAEQALLNRELAEVPTSIGMTASIGAPPRAVVGQSATANTPDLPDNWLYVSASAHDQPSAVEAQWYASLVARAYANQAPSTGITALAGASVTTTDSSGAKLDDDAWLVPTYTPSATVDESALVSRFRAGTADAGVTFLGANFSNLLGQSPVIRVRTSDPASFVSQSNRLLTDILGGNTDGFDGYLIEVDDNSGGSVMVAAVTPGLHSGEIWARPGLDGPFHYGRR